jgi:hypothetical protein
MIPNLVLSNQVLQREDTNKRPKQQAQMTKKRLIKS